MILYLTKASFDSAASTTVLEDFEGITPKDTPLASFVSNGVTYTGLAGAPSPNVWVASPGYSNFGAGVAQPTSTSILTANGDEDFTIDFSTPPLAVGFDVYFNGLGTVTTRVTTLEPLSVHRLRFPQPRHPGVLRLREHSPDHVHPLHEHRWRKREYGHRQHCRLVLRARTRHTCAARPRSRGSRPAPPTQGRIERGLPPGSGRLLAQGRPCCVRAASAAAGVGPT